MNSKCIGQAKQHGIQGTDADLLINSMEQGRGRQVGRWTSSSLMACRTTVVAGVNANHPEPKRHMYIGTLKVERGLRCFPHDHPRENSSLNLIQQGRQPASHSFQQGYEALEETMPRPPRSWRALHTHLLEQTTQDSTPCGYLASNAPKTKLGQGPEHYCI